MSAVDKLHKLYSSTFEPLVWARSVGLEALNEFDTVKAAIMMSAGASPRVYDGMNASTGWNLTARVVESVTNSISVAKMANDALVGMIGNGLHGIWKANTPPDRK